MLEKHEDLTKIKVEEKDGQVFVYRPKCPVCAVNMVKGIWKYYEKRQIESIYKPEKLYIQLLYVCKKHTDKREQLTSEQLGILNSYTLENQQFVSY